MKINIKTTGMLDEFLPPEKTGNRLELDVPPDTTPAAVIHQLNFPDSMYLVSINDELVPTSAQDSHRLEENDEMTIMPPLTGG